VSAISPRRTGVVVFGARVASIFTGLLFIVMVTHTLTTSEFGLLEIVTDIVVFSTYPLGVFNFWISRDTARGMTVGRTAVLTNLVLSAAGCAIFAVLAFLGESALASSLYLFGFALLLVPISYWYTTVNAILSAHHPQASGYTLLFTEVTKLAAAYYLLYVLRAGLPGVLLALAVSNLAQGALGSYFVRDTFAGAVSLERWKVWFKSAWIPALNSVPYVIGIADTYVAFLVSGGYTLTGYYQAAFSIAAIVGYSGYLSYALYPLLLRGVADRLIGVLFDFSMLFGVPMAVGVAALSPQFLYLLSRRYVLTSVPLVILAFAALANAIDTLLDNSLMGRDTSDLQEGNKFATLRKGNLFFVPMANMLYGVLYISSVAVIAYLGTAAGLPYAETITFWAAAQLILILAIAALKVRRLGLGALAGTGASIAYYSFSAAVMGAAVYLAAPLLLAFNMPALYFGLRLALLVAAGGGVYFGILAAIDRKTRERILKLSRTMLV
jgi:O-antigen/teichoic acid export membrane protein